MRYAIILVFCWMNLTVLAQNNKTSELLSACNLFQEINSSNGGWIGDITVSPNGFQLATVTSSEIEIYNLQNWSHIQTMTLNTHLEADSGKSDTDTSAYNISATWSPQNNLLAVSYYHNLTSQIDPVYSIDIWDVIKNRVINTISSPAFELQWSPAGNVIAGLKMGSIYIWDAHTLEQIAIFDNQFYGQLAWYPDGSHITGMGAEDGTWMWNLADKTGVKIAPTLFVGSAGLIDWSPDGKWLSAVTINGLYIYDKTGKEKFTLNPEIDILSQGWSSDSKYLALGTKHGFIVFDIKGNEVVNYLNFEQEIADIEHLAWLPDTSMLLSANSDGNIYKWDVANECLAGIIQNLEQ